MYMSKMLEIGKAANGFVISCQVPIKKDNKKGSKMENCCCPSSSSCEREYIAKDAKEVCDLIEEIMPLLDVDYTSEDDFDKAFNEAMDSEDETKEDE